LIGLLGVLVGAAITAGFGYLHDRQQESLDLRVAKREVAQEIALIGVGLQFFEVSGQRDPRSDIARLLPATEWPQNEGVLARNLPDGVWLSVASFYGNVAGLRHILIVRQGQPSVADQKQAKALSAAAQTVLHQLGTPVQPIVAGPAVTVTSTTP
jgi:hypothetical protein